MRMQRIKEYNPNTTNYMRMQRIKEYNPNTTNYMRMQRIKESLICSIRVEFVVFAL